uniref:Vitellogenin n=1 Tax=Acrobeloides nanus TaxID=290746 RepID=A0A914E2F7_9BILA
MQSCRIEGNIFHVIRVQQLTAKPVGLDFQHRDTEICLNGKDFYLPMGCIFQCASIKTNDVSKSSLAKGKNCQEVKKGEVALTEFLRSRWNLNYGDTVDIAQLSPIEHLEPSYVMVNISGGDLEVNQRPTILERPLRLSPSHLEVLAANFKQANMDNLLTWNETQKMNITVKPWTDLTPHESTYKQLTFGVTSIKTIRTGVPSPYEYVNTETEVICQNVLDSLESVDSDLEKLENNKYKLLAGPTHGIGNWTLDSYLYYYDSEKARLEREKGIQSRLLSEYYKAKVDDRLRPLLGTSHVASSSHGRRLSISSPLRETMDDLKDGLGES